MANLSIRSKLLVMLLAVSLFSIAVVASLNYYTCYETLKSAIFSHLTSVRASRADQIEQNFARLRAETIVLASSNAVRSTRRASSSTRTASSKARPSSPKWTPRFGRSISRRSCRNSKRRRDRTVEIDSLLPETPAGRYLQYHYIARNPFPIGEMGGMLRADDASDYSRVHETFHPTLRRLIQTFGFAGIYLIDIETGAIVYTEGKRPDFATRLSDGHFARTNLGDLFRRVQRAPGSQHRRGRGFPALSADARRTARIHRRAGIRRRPCNRRAGVAAVSGWHQPRHDVRPAMGARRARQDRRGVSGRPRLPDALGLALPARIAAAVRGATDEERYAAR